MVISDTDPPTKNTGVQEEKKIEDPSALRKAPSRYFGSDPYREKEI
jgi:hypothetical protein